MRNHYLLLALALFYACASPSKALEKGQTKKAMRLAKSDLKKQKNIAENIAVINEASQIEIDKILESNSNKISSPEVKDWIKVQNNYFALLEDIGEANQMTSGQISEPYDRLCEFKTDLDYKIADHYYKEGENYLFAFQSTGMKHLVKSAYYSYNTSEEYGGLKYHDDITEKKDYCVEHGRVYYIANNYDPSNNLFFRPLPHDSDQSADCIINSNRSGYSLSESRNSSQMTFQEVIKVGQESKIDTAGVVTYTPIYQTVYAYKNTTVITMSLSTTTWINVNDETGQCPLSSWSFNKEVSDSYEEVTYTGDSRAYPNFANDETGQPAFFISNLEDDLDRVVDRELGI